MYAPPRFGKQRVIWSQGFLVVLGLAAMLLGGCDPTGTYERRRSASLTQVKQKSGKLALLGDEVSVPDHTGKASSGVTFQVPKMFGNQPGSAGVPGQTFRSTIAYELAETFGDGPLLYIAAVGAEEADNEEAMQNLLVGAIKALSPEVSVEARSEQPASLGSKEVPTMLHVTATGPQPFFVAAGQGKRPEPQLKNGRTEIYIVKAPSCVVAFIFRATEAGFNADNFEASIEASMQTVALR
jgi:hypothetical protein